ncbi:hypothetical protein RND81_12G000200 [Saponaria officinalis]|uniref:C2H2-type domain-containing protein n=1 Tax=Saponaria officinalis TaxID=3572 RepID=A0AAW1H1E2_SAPOF
MGLICPNKSNGCNMLLSIEDFDLHSCPNSVYTCPLCRVDFIDIRTLKLHLEIHTPLEVPLRENFKITIGHGDKRLLKEKGSRNFFLLSFEDSSLMVNHMWWDESRSFGLIVDDDDSDDTWCLTGNTSDTRSGSVVQRLQLPMSSIPGESITISMSLGRESDAKRTVAVLKNLGRLECEICCKIVTPPVYHCYKNHGVCGICFKKFPEQQRRQCRYCFQGVTICRTASYILRNSQWYCSNENKGCQHIMPIENYERHVDKCLKRRFYCPMCNRGFDTLDFLKDHLRYHNKNKLKYMKETTLTLCRGRYLLQEESTSTDEYFLLIFEDNCICLQHMCWASKENYYMEFEDLGCDWAFYGETTEVEKIPRLSARFMSIPETVLNPKSILPIPITVRMLHGGF